MPSKGLIRFQMFMLRLLPHLPGKDRIASRIVAGINKAATAITLPVY
jgi:hypothetical protein